ncbi:hypothetical protein MVEN_00455000 [Mycena venus]|uniref:CCHC-type domain-containing protein n=1 Tax=Mycena venus TaxID=2733690 RepID=A0A8H6YW63_9AGAR|nr:hypothetical protein MVEN_00455000 [Mycena venus]
MSDILDDMELLLMYLPLVAEDTRTLDLMVPVFIFAWDDVIKSLLRSQPCRRRIIFGAHREGFLLAIDSGSTRSLRSNPLRDLRLELLSIHQNPDDLLDSDDFFTVVPDHLAQHNNLSPLDSASPTLANFFLSPPVTRPTTPSLFAMATPIPMPARGDRNAPQFDSLKPRELQRYFTDLEYHFTRSSVTDDAEKKKHATRFLGVDDQDIWEALPEFQAPHTYAVFKAAVLKLYPGNDADRKYSLADLDALVGQYARVGILSKGDYSEFYRQFLVITTYLIARHRLSTTEQSKAFRRAISPPRLWQEVELRLKIKKPDVHPDDPYEIADLNEAVEFALATTSSAPVSTATSQMPTSQSQSDIKQEPGITALLESMNGLIKVLTAQHQHSHSHPPASQPSHNPPRNDQTCSYCGEPGHFIIKCPRVEEDMNAGKCKRNAEGRVTLPSGAFVPRHVIGPNLRARIDEWHRQNPGQLAAAQLLFEVATQRLTAAPPPPVMATTTFQLSEEDRIRSLEHEIFALRTRAQARRAIAAGEPVETPEQPIRAASPPVNNAPVPDPVPAVPPVILRPQNRPSAPPAPQTEHPFAKARDAAYAPPRDRNVGALPNSAAGKKPDPAYRSTAPIYDEKIAHTVFDRSMNTPITLTQRELLSLSPDVRAQVREATTSRRVVSNPKDKPANTSSAPPVDQFVLDPPAP